MTECRLDPDLDQPLYLVPRRRLVMDLDVLGKVAVAQFGHDEGISFRPPLLGWIIAALDRGQRLSRQASRLFDRHVPVAPDCDLARPPLRIPVLDDVCLDTACDLSP
jgi:hypothetical protein